MKPKKPPESTHQKSARPQPAETSLSTSPGNNLSTWLQPTALPPPAVDATLTSLGAVERSAEVLRYTIQRTEHWLSPEGLLREWLRRSLRVTVAVAIPAVLLAPVISLLLGRLQSWSAYAVEIAHNISQIPAQLSSGMFFIGVAYLLVRWLMRR